MPAHYCGVYAHKPTLQLVASRGHTPPPLPPLPVEHDLAVVGPMARSAADLALLLDVIAGPDELDSGVAHKLDLSACAPYRLEELSHPGSRHAPAAADRQQRARGDRTLADNLAKRAPGSSGRATSCPISHRSARLYMRMLLSFLAATFPPEALARAQGNVAKLDPSDTSLAAERLRGMVLSHREWVLANGARNTLRAQWRALFSRFDAVICPIMPTAAYPHDHSPDQGTRVIMIDNAPHPYSDQLTWPGVATLPGLPATSIPIGFSTNDLPVGVQIIGPWLEDRTPLKLAELIEREFGGFVPPKGSKVHDGVPL